MRIASVAKAFSGAVALSLVSKGVLSLNDTIGELLPKLPETWHAVRLRHWLNHTSGIPDFSQDEDFLAAVMAHPKEAPPPEELLSYVEDEPLNFEPGTRYEYSNSDNIAVGLMIEAATTVPTRAGSRSTFSGHWDSPRLACRPEPTFRRPSSTATTHQRVRRRT
jgi:D-alanyl-D-alanine carboxypeptidase